MYLLSMVKSPKGAMMLALLLVQCLSLIKCSPTIPISTTSVLIDHLSNEEYDATEVLSHSSINSNMLMYYSYFTSMGYCKDEQVSKGECCKYVLKDKWEMVNHGVDPKNSLNNYVFVKSDAYKKFIFAFPGTRGGTELTEEILKGYLVNYGGDNGMKVSSYFKERSDGLTPLVFTESNMNVIKENEGYEVVFAGHSLGGALATILSLTSVLDKHIDKEHHPIVLFTINTPRAGNDIFAKEVMANIPVVFRLVRKGDLVSHVPPCLINIKGKCQTIFDQDEFNMKIDELNKTSLYYWHIGGLILMNKEMDEAVICPSNQGENFERDCKNPLSVNITLHNYIFNNQYGLYERCTRREGDEQEALDYYY